MSVVKWVAGGAGIVLAAFAAVPWYMGTKTEETFREYAAQPADAVRSPVTVKIVRYDRGWLSSSALTRISLAAEPNFYVDVRHEISQVPHPSGSLVKVHSVPQFSSGVREELTHYFGEQAPFSVDTFVRYNGERLTTVSSPAFEKPMRNLPGTTMHWGGLSGTVAIDAQEQLAAKIRLPGLKVTGQMLSAELGTLTMEANWRVAGAVINWEGDTKVALDRLTYSGLGSQGSLDQLALNFYQRNQGDNVDFGYLLRVGAVQVTHGSAAEQSYSNAVLELEVANVNRKALTQYVDAVGGGADSRPIKLSPQQTLDLAAELLRSSPTITLKQLAVQTPKGTVSAQATVSFDGKDLQAVQFSPQLIERVRMKASLSISDALLRSELQRKMGAQMDIGSTQPQAGGGEVDPSAIPANPIDEQIKRLTDAGFLRVQDSQLMIDAELVSGRFMINGQPADQLFGGAMPFLAPVPQPQPEASPAGSQVKF